MTLYALVDSSGAITNIVSPPDGQTVKNLSFLTRAQKASAVAVPGTLVIDTSWTYDGKEFVPPGGIQAPSLSAQAGMMLGKGLVIQSKSDPTINGLYDCSAGSQLEILAEMTSLIANGTFADGSVSILWPDTSGVYHKMTAPQFKSFATAIGIFVSALSRIRRMDTGTLPSGTSLID